MQHLLDEFTYGQLNATVKKIGGKTAVERFLRGELVIVEAASLAKPKRSSKAKAEPTLDSIVRADRSIRPVYPDFVKSVMHPEFEKTSPAEFDLSKVEQWLHDGQKNGSYVTGKTIYEHLKATDELKTCLGLADLQAIQKLGTAVFRKHFAGKAVFGWAGVVRSRNGDLRAPCLCEIVGQVKLDWRWLGNDWSGSYPALRFANQD
jgi:hypothetical protein